MTSFDRSTTGGPLEAPPSAQAAPHAGRPTPDRRLRHLPAARDVQGDLRRARGQLLAIPGEGIALPSLPSWATADGTAAQRTMEEAR